MGSRSTIDLAYIAGFLDGDGSLMLQLKKRKDGPSKFRFMATICLYQDSRHDESLAWIQKILRIGYLSKRNDGMTELRVNGFVQVRDLLRELLPYTRFKKVQARALHTACTLLSEKTLRKLSKEELKQLVSLMLVIQQENYVTKKKRSQKELFEILGLTP
ncbi:MAG: hypothetical protein COV10_01770 [Candidatus Vogelbacteria bacterium CG10_big_fil_rev_8_21_14_0_10_51_16]|uniref:Homing endonuclease LAGLIDADG domain-containing protein n=1 Tax=Candidatus Vogelbacteria bacterium CG10_big_fil_rev_8_21_14_0_10_51_16 TaxID=1975045 RepID=A0A2H0RES2_9BACT|nr:MAG: hypothetical protein COV10_01770 [Candidatus Vogelbacteria bacterium CG10_big_fil_rev_8_21_14_0_10_51_16]